MYTLYNQKHYTEEEVATLVNQARQGGFQAGFAAAQQQPQAKIEDAFAQGRMAGYLKAQQDFFATPKKNGVGY